MAEREREVIVVIISSLGLALGVNCGFDPSVEASLRASFSTFLDLSFYQMGRDLKGHSFIHSFTQSAELAYLPQVTQFLVIGNLSYPQMAEPPSL